MVDSSWTPTKPDLLVSKMAGLVEFGLVQDVKAMVIVKLVTVVSIYCDGDHCFHLAYNFFTLKVTRLSAEVPVVCPQ